MTQMSVLDAEAAGEAADGLLARVAAGDAEAFEALYRRTSPTLLGVCVRVLADRDEAEEVLQDVYVAVWNKAGQFDRQRARALTWLAAMARHRAIDRLRSLPARATRVAVDAIDAAPDAGPSPVAATEAALEADRLDECLGRLEPNRQQLIRTAFYEGATYEELATRSGSPLGSVKSWIRRGLAQLRECLER